MTAGPTGGTFAQSVIKVFTRKSFEAILSERGIGPFKLNQDRASECLYVVAVRKAGDALIEKGIAHRTAFMIGKITELVESGDRNILAFDEYALLSIPDAWERNGNPVAYTSLEEIGIDARTLRWEKHRTTPGSNSR